MAPLDSLIIAMFVLAIGFGAAHLAVFMPLHTEIRRRPVLLGTTKALSARKNAAQTKIAGIKLSLDEGHEETEQIHY